MFKEQEPMKSALIVVGGDLKMNPKIQAKTPLIKILTINTREVSKANLDQH
jgi:hypothetical protein